MPQIGSGSDINTAVLHCNSSVSRRKSQAALPCATLRRILHLLCVPTNPAISRSRHLLAIEAVEYHHKLFSLQLSLSTKCTATITKAINGLMQVAVTLLLLYLFVCIESKRKSELIGASLLHSDTFQ